MFRRFTAAAVCFTFIFSNFQYVHAQEFSIDQLPMPGTMVGLSSPFAPLALKGIVVDLQKPLEFQFIVDTGKGPQNTTAIKEEANRLVKYFLAGLTIPEGDLWVNLSPYEKDRMVPDALGQTDLGRDLLAQDYILKQLTASLIYPEKDLGKEFWAKVYKKAQEQFGTTNIPVNTFNKVWILPDQAQVFENKNAAYVTRSTLKVMLDEDYLALNKKTIPSPAVGRAREGGNVNTLGSQIVREVILPEIEKEVNTGTNFAPLRQIYQALILAKWYKETVKNALLEAVYLNKQKVAGVDLNDPAVKEQIYNRYLQAYKKGVFNYIKEDPTPDGQVVPRKYFSGGFTELGMKLDRTGSAAMISSGIRGALLALTISLILPVPMNAQQQNSNFLGSVEDKIISQIHESQKDRLLEQLESNDFGSRLRAAADLKSMGVKSAHVLVLTCENDNDAQEALVKMGSTVVPTLIKEWKATGGYRVAGPNKYGITKVLIKIGKPAVSGLLDALKDKDVRVAALNVLGEIGWEPQTITEQMLNGYLGSLSSDDKGTRDNAEKQLNRLGVGKEQLIQGYIRAFSSYSLDVFSNAEKKLGDLGASREQMIDGYFTALSSEQFEVRSNAEKKLEDLGVSKEQMVDGYIRVLSTIEKPVVYTDHSVILDAIVKLGGLGDKRAIEPIREWLDFLDNGKRPDGYFFSSDLLAPAKKALVKLGASKWQQQSNLNRAGIVLSSIAGVGVGIIGLLAAWKKLRGDSAMLQTPEKPQTPNKDAAMFAKTRIAAWKLTGNVDKIVTMLSDESESVRQVAEDTLAKLGASREQMANGYIAVLDKKYGEARIHAIKKLGDLGDKRAIEPLFGALNDYDKVVSLSVAIALGQLGDKRAIGLLLLMLNAGDNSSIFAEKILTDLGVNKEQIIAAYIPALSSLYSWNRKRAALRLGDLGGNSAIEPLLKNLGDEDKNVRSSAEEALAKLGASKEQMLNGYIAVLASWNSEYYSLRKEHREDRRNAVEKLGDLGDKRAIEPLLNLLGDDDTFHDITGSPVFINVEKALVKLGVSKEQMVSGYIMALRSKNYAYENAIEKLGDLGDRRAIEALVQIKSSAAAKAVIKIGGYEHENILKVLLNWHQSQSGAHGNIFNFLNEAIGYKSKGINFRIIYEPATYRQEYGRIGEYEDGWHDVEDKPEVLRIEPDRAMLLTSAKNPQDLGGIDLNQINVNREGKAVVVQFDPAQLNELMRDGFEGFMPVIINITPIQSPLPLLGVNQSFQ